MPLDLHRFSRRHSAGHPGTGLRRGRHQREKTVHVTARESAETALNTLETLVEAAAQQLAQDVLVDILTVISVGKNDALKRLVKP